MCECLGVQVIPATSFHMPGSVALRGVQQPTPLMPAPRTWKDLEIYHSRLHGRLTPSPNRNIINNKAKINLIYAAFVFAILNVVDK